MALLAGDVWSCSQAGRSRNIRSAPAKVAGSVKPKPDHLEMVVAAQGRADPCESPWLRSGSARRRRGAPTPAGADVAGGAPVIRMVIAAHPGGRR